MPAPANQYHHGHFHELLIDCAAIGCDFRCLASAPLGDCCFYHAGHDFGSPLNGFYRQIYLDSARANDHDFSQKIDRGYGHCDHCRDRVLCLYCFYCVAHDHEMHCDQMTHVDRVRSSVGHENFYLGRGSCRYCDCFCCCDRAVDFDVRGNHANCRALDCAGSFRGCCFFHAEVNDVCFGCRSNQK